MENAIIKLYNIFVRLDYIVMKFKELFWQKKIITMFFLTLTHNLHNKIFLSICNKFSQWFHLSFSIM